MRGSLCSDLKQNYDDNRARKEARMQEMQRELETQENTIEDLKD